MFIKKLMNGVAVIGIMALANSEANAIPVDLELVLAVDVSTSVNATEFGIQRTGYVNAFNDAGIQADIASLGGTALGGGIAAALVCWSSGQVVGVSFTHIFDAATAGAFATAVGAAARPGTGTVGCCTGIGDGITFSQGLFAGNGFEGPRNVIDVSGDGANNTGGSVTAARDAADLAGTVINGLSIGPLSLLTYYQNNVVTPTGFTLQVADFATFGSAVKIKIAAEISGGDPNIPEPGTLAIFGLGLAGLGLMRRRRAA